MAVVTSEQPTGSVGAPREAPTGTTAPTQAPDAAPLTPGGVLSRRTATPFQVHLEIFDGPFDLLLGLISKHKLDITQVALAEVTDEFIGHMKAHQQGGWDLSQASEFLLVAATLLDLKAARLLPRRSVEDEEDLALIEARDLLFARLLQYRAFKDVAAGFAAAMAAAGRMHPRAAGMEERFATLLPELVMGVTPEQLAMLAARASTPRTAPGIDLAHLHRPVVSVREQAAILTARLRGHGRRTFRDLVADAPDPATIVARFLALLELFREAAVSFAQDQALGELSVLWTGGDRADIDVDDEFDDQPDDDLDEQPDDRGAEAATGPRPAPAETPEHPASTSE